MCRSDKALGRSSGAWVPAGSRPPWGRHTASGSRRSRPCRERGQVRPPCHRSENGGLPRVRQADLPGGGFLAARSGRPVSIDPGVRADFSACSFLCPLKNLVQRLINALPFCEKLTENLFAVGGQTIEPLVALVLFAPLADKQSLAFKTAEEGVERPFIDFQPVVSKSFAQGVAVTLLAKLSQNRETQASAAQFQLEVLKQL